MRITFALAICGLTAVSLTQAQTADPAASAAAASYFRANAARLGLTNPAEELQLRKATTDAQGVAHLHFNQSFRGVPVFEGEAIAHVDRSGAVTLTNSLRGNLNIGVMAGVGQAAAVSAAASALRIQGPFDVRAARLEILPRGSRSPVDVLAWHVSLFVENDVDAVGKWDVFVNAGTGNLVWAFNSLETSTGIGRTMYSLNVSLSTDTGTGGFVLRDLLRGNGNYTLDMHNLQVGRGTLVSDSADDFGDNSINNTDRDTAPADAHFGLQQTWDYYGVTYGRNGIDGAGSQTYSRTHYARNYQNAFWDDGCFCMTYGDGGSTFLPLVSLDVAGHEMSHGVMAAEANLTYSGESGGLNESNSDIFGTMVEFYSNNALDVPDYWIGEMIYKSNWSGGVFTPVAALRYMDDPHKDGTSPACWSSTLGSLDVHYSSGPNNHMFWLLSHGGTSKCNGNVVTGIGNAKASALWYKAITDYMTSSTNYHGALTAALNAAAALYGTGSTEYNAVAAAYAAINVT